MRIVFAVERVVTFASKIHWTLHLDKRCLAPATQAAKQPRLGGLCFRDKIVVVGAEGNWQHDEHATPSLALAAA